LTPWLSFHQQLPTTTGETDLSSYNTTETNNHQHDSIPVIQSNNLHNRSDQQLMFTEAVKLVKSRLKMTRMENFQPQVRDATNGPNIHTYIPRGDGTVLISGVVFIPQTMLPAAAFPVTIQPYGGPPGGPPEGSPGGPPGAPAFNVLATP
jgi:hypothetical protein